MHQHEERPGPHAFAGEDMQADDLCPGEAVPLPDADPHAFVADRLAYINGLLYRFNAEGKPTELRDIAGYALEAGGKRIRPALTLMLADSLGVEPRTIEPLLIAIEFFHTSTLLFDDLPAQDNATLRRGRPAAHLVYDEGSVQLAGLSMFSSGFGVLARLRGAYPADRVTQVLEYAGTVLGPARLAHGQNIDLHMERNRTEANGEAILEMYALKTSAMIEAALVPLMILTGRPEAEIERTKQYAYHAGIVFQLRDDILDASSTAANLGKDTNSDIGKTNIVRFYGTDEAERLMRFHLAQAVASCRCLPFDTALLQGVVWHFATRAA